MRQSIFFFFFFFFFMLELYCVATDTVASGATRTVMVMATVHALRQGGSGSLAVSTSSLAQPELLQAATASQGESNGSLAESASSSSQPELFASPGVSCLEGCGLGWRVPPTLSRRSPWTVVAQRTRLCIEAVGGAKVERLYTLLDHTEVSPRVSYEVSLDDLHAGDKCYILVRLTLPALGAPAPLEDVIRVSLAYVDAVSIDTKSCEAGVGIARPQVCSSAARTPQPEVELPPDDGPSFSVSIPQCPPRPDAAAPLRPDRWLPPPLSPVSTVC